MRLILMGTGPFAVPSARDLVRRHDVVAVCTQPLPPADRGRKKVPPNPLREFAEAERLPLLDPANINTVEIQERLSSLAADLFFVCDYGQILSAETLALARWGGVNLHGSLLPKYRGAAPVAWAIWEGETETGVTVIHMTPRLDAGPCLVQKRLAIGPAEEAPQLEQRLADLGVSAVDEALQMLAEWDGVSPLGVLQSDRQSSRAPRLRKSDGRVDWNQDPRRIVNQVRALKPWPTTYAFLTTAGGEPLRLILEEVRVDPEPRAEAEPGTILGSESGILRVACGTGGAIRIDALRPAGRRAMTSAEFLRGHPPGSADRFVLE